MTISQEKINEVYYLISKERKARINWVLTITQLTFDELEVVAKKLGLVIKGEYIVLPEDAAKITKAEKWQPTPVLTKEQIHMLKLKRCPICGILLEGTENAKVLEGFCFNCGADFNMLFSHNDKFAYFQKKCDNCGAINPVKARFCFQCGSAHLTRIIPSSSKYNKFSKSKPNPLQIRDIIYFSCSLIISIAGLIYAAIEFSKEGQIARSIAIGVIIVALLILAVPLYYLRRYRLWQEYQYYREFFDE
ncbi:MAG: zinc ribbon domain-containing protein [Candidatus Heimdallarchaeota archaeon]|nr:zinc ribbon domain-containing protein [Candidatus Heimdallarchaeota archaeon]